ncbi:MAG: hypothetical protein NVSMB9_16500 [Isosphaeraceae bacterium]
MRQDPLTIEELEGARPHATSSSLAPPHPNLGPEPMDSGVPSWYWTGWFTFLIVLASVLAWRRRRRTRESSGLAVVSSKIPLAPDPPPVLDGTLLERAETIRSALATAFGPGWRAKTSEEISQAPELSATFGLVTSERIAWLLRRADHQKFSASDQELSEPRLDAAHLETDWISEFLETVRSRPGFQEK